MTDETNTNTPDYLGQGLRGPIWALFGVATAAAAKYALGGNFLGVGNVPPSGDPPWARDMNYERELTVANAKIGQLEAEKYADGVTLAAERRLADKIEAVEKAMNAGVAAQAVLNAKQEAFVAAIAGQVASFDAMTARFIKQPVMAASEAALSAFKANTASTASTTGAAA